MKKEKPIVQLTNTDGNAMAIIAACRKAGRRAGWGEDKLSEFSTEALAGDYDHVLQTAMKYFEVE